MMLNLKFDTKDDLVVDTAIYILGLWYEQYFHADIKLEQRKIINKVFLFLNKHTIKHLENMNYDKLLELNKNLNSVGMNVEGGKIALDLLDEMLQQIIIGKPNYPDKDLLLSAVEKMKEKIKNLNI